jgi:hypothetical protein
MAKYKVKLVQLGKIPFKLNKGHIKKFKSSIFEIDGEIDKVSLKNTRYSGDVCTYENDELEDQIPNPEHGIDFVLAITNCALRDDYYARRLADNKVIFTFRNTRFWLEKAHLPLENAVLKMIYEYCIMYDRDANRIRKMDICFLHHETRSCLYDFDGVLEDVMFTFNKPGICNECEVNLTERGTPINMIKTARKELKQLKKTVFYRMFDWVKENPLRSLIISLLATVVINVSSSKLYSLIWKCGR